MMVDFGSVVEGEVLGRLTVNCTSTVRAPAHALNPFALKIVTRYDF